MQNLPFDMSMTHRHKSPVVCLGVQLYTRLLSREIHFQEQSHVYELRRLLVKWSPDLLED